jgi:peptidoglycan/LPS O-acetylase OafA/YrhL
MTISDHKPHYPALDGLRGAAIILVVLLHNFKFVNYFHFGWLGVDLFFVLSGFLITENLLQSLDKPKFLQNFYTRRLLRIFPLYFLLLIIGLFVLPLVKTIDMSYYTSNQVWLWTLLQNWLYIFKPPYGDQSLLHTWSLAVEEQFYLLWPVVVLLVRRPGRLLLIALFVLALAASARALVWYYEPGSFGPASFYTFTRIDGLCIGCMIALFMKINRTWISDNMWLLVVGTSILNFAFYFLDARYGNTLPYFAFAGYTTFPILFGLLTYEAVVEKTKIINMIFANRFMQFFGRISYSLYLFHWPIYTIFSPILSKALVQQLSMSNKQAVIVSSVAVTIFAIGLSVLSLRYFESYFFKLKKKLA